MKRLGYLIFTAVLLLQGATLALAQNISIDPESGVIAAEDVPENSMLIAAAYADDVLADVRIYKNSGDFKIDYTQDFDAVGHGIDLVKLFLWENDTLRPITNTVNAEISATAAPVSTTAPISEPVELETISIRGGSPVTAGESRVYTATPYSSIDELKTVTADSPERNVIYTSGISDLKSTVTAVNSEDAVKIMRYRYDETEFADKNTWDTSGELNDGDILVVKATASDGSRTSYYKFYISIIPFEEGSYSAQTITFPYRQAKINEDCGGKAALVILLHGASGSGDDNVKNMNNSGVMSVSGYLSSVGKKVVFLVPQAPKDKNVWWGTDTATHDLLQLIDFITADSSLNIDTNQIYVMGASLGGSETFDLLIERPDFFAGAIVIDSAPRFDETDIVKQTPLYYFVGNPGGGAYRMGAEDFSESLKALGGEVWYGCIEGDHSTACSEGYKDDDALKWLFSHTK